MTQSQFNIPQKQLDYLLEGLAITGLILGFVIVLLTYNSLPDQIPSHINAAGKVDSYAGKSFIWILPSISLLLYIILTLINKSPHQFNYPVKITAENKTRQYTIATRLNRMIKAWCCLFFALFTYQFIQLAKHGAEEMSMASVIIFIAGIVGIIGYYWWMSSRSA